MSDIKYTIVKDVGKFYLYNWVCHRIGEPAIEWLNGDKSYYKYGKLHNDKGPALVRVNGDDSYYLEGKKVKVKKKPQDYFFYVYSNKSLTEVKVVSKKAYKTKCFKEESYEDVVKFFPKAINKKAFSMGHYNSNVNVDNTKEDMIKSGFEYNQDIQDLVIQVNSESIDLDILN